MQSKIKFIYITCGIRFNQKKMYTIFIKIIHALFFRSKINNIIYSDLYEKESFFKEINKTN